MERTGAARHWVIWAAVLPILVWALVRIAGVDGGWPLVPLLAYTPYVAFVALLGTGLAAALRNWAATATAALALVLLAVAVVPRAVGSGDKIPPGASELRIVSANIHLGAADPETLVHLVRSFHADVLNLQEVTPVYVLELRRAGLGRLLPHAIVHISYGGVGGAGIYSRYPMRQLPAPPESSFRMPRAELTLGNGARVRFVDVHPLHPSRSTDSYWQAQLASLPAPGAGPPWVLAGDFNATLDFPELRDVIDNGYRDAGDVTGEGLQPTWPSSGIWPPPVTIDHVLAQRGIAIAGYAVEDLPGSDHRAIFARLAVPPPRRG